MEAVEKLDEAPYTYGIANDEVELYLVRAAQALAKDAIEQAVGVYNEEGPGERKFASGAQNVHQYVHWAAPRFFDKEYQRSLMAEFREMYEDAVDTELRNYDENRP